jgi:hypothetical protein
VVFARVERVQHQPVDGGADDDLARQTRHGRGSPRPCPEPEVECKTQESREKARLSGSTRTSFD